MSEDQRAALGIEGGWKRGDERRKKGEGETNEQGCVPRSFSGRVSLEREALPEGESVQLGR